MHSMTRALAPARAANARMRSCSMMFALAGRNTGYSSPSCVMTRGNEPVVLAMVATPLARKPAAINRVTEDLPRVPLT